MRRYRRRDATRKRYDAFLDAMVYGGAPEFGAAMATVTDWTEILMRLAHDEYPGEGTASFPAYDRLSRDNLDHVVSDNHRYS